MKKEKIYKLLNKKRFSIPIGIILLILIFILYLFFGPITVSFQSADRITYDESLRKIDELTKLDTDSINDKCKSIILNHGKQTEKSIVFYHGYTNCPEQFRDLGQKFYDLGYNVLIPRIPSHGEKDRLTTSPSNLTPNDLTNFVRETSLIVSGLGKNVYTSGISGGGVLAATSGYYYKFISKVLIMSPLFIAYDLENWQLGPFIKMRNFMPDYYRWWDMNTKEKISGPNYAYPQFSFKGSMAFMEVGYRLMLEVESNSAVINKDVKIIHIYTENDIAVKNGFNNNILDTWAKKIGTTSEKYMFPASYNFNHDIIDKNQATARPDIVYPVIVDLAEKI